MTNLENFLMAYGALSYASDIASKSAGKIEVTEDYALFRKSVAEVKSLVSNIIECGTGPLSDDDIKEMNAMISGFKIGLVKDIETAHSSVFGDDSFLLKEVEVTI